MFTEFALLACHVSTTEEPLGTVVGWACSVIAGWALLAVCGAIEPPPHPTDAIKTERKKTNA